MNIPEARVAMRSLKPAAIALDRFLEGEDSLFYIQKLKAGGYQGPIIVISVVDDEKSALEAGADRFLTKPIAPFKLAITLKELLEGELRPYGAAGR